MMRLSSPCGHLEKCRALERAVVAALSPLVMVWLGTLAVTAHEVRPGYLELVEEAPGEFSVLLKTPMQGDLRLALVTAFSGAIEELSPMVSRPTGDAMVQTWRIRAIEPLAGQSISIDGLQSTMTDVLVRVAFAGGESWTDRLAPSRPIATVPAHPTALATGATYLQLGIEHILLGFDHLLFVLALLILTDGTWRLVKTITAFTIAHSITLALATLGLVNVPAPPVEAIIALSIVFVAVEIVRVRNGHASVAARAPWLIAFAFGLLHGLGFAGAHSEIGLPPGQVPLALLFFNLGVEAGQLLFVAAVLVLGAILRKSLRALPTWSRLVPPYAIGNIAMFWVFERIASF